MKRFFELWNSIRYSLWFVPIVILMVAVLFAIGAIELDGFIDDEMLSRWPKLFGASADGARVMLQVVASAMITVAGLTFSITVLTLSLASSQYTPRLIRIFMGSRPTQTVLGTFLGIFVYCVIVLRSIRGGEEAFVPSIAVTIAVGLALLGAGVLIFFIHYIASSIQASAIVSFVSDETIQMIDRIYPEPLSAHTENKVGQLFPDKGEPAWHPVLSSDTGYLQSIDAEELLASARKYKTVVRMEKEIGEFVAAGMPIASAGISLSEEMIDEINDAISISHYRTVEQDIGVGIRQLVDIALRAMSPAMNDTTTAIMCVDYLSAIMVKLANRRIKNDTIFSQGEPMVILKEPSFEEYLRNAFELIRENAKDNAAVYARLLHAFESMACQTADSARRDAIAAQVKLVVEYAHQSALHSDQVARLHERAFQVFKACQVNDA